MALTLPYPALDFVPLDILTAEEMNEIVANYTYIANQFPLSASALGAGSVTYAKLGADVVAPEKIYEYVQETDSDTDVVQNIAVDFTTYRRIIIDADFLAGTGIPEPYWEVVRAQEGQTSCSTAQSGWEVSAAEQKFIRRNDTPGEIIAAGVAGSRETLIHIDMTATTETCFPNFFAQGTGGSSGDQRAQDINGRIYCGANDITAIPITLVKPRVGSSVIVCGYRR